MLSEVPSAGEVDYILVPAAGKARDDLVVFCLDVSGSMCVSYEMPGKPPRKIVEQLARQGGFGEQEMAFPGDCWYITRLQALQSAVDKQLDTLPDSTRVALVTFAEEVVLYGDCRIEPRVLAGGKLESPDVLRSACEAMPTPGPLRDTKEQIRKKIWDVVEGGRTALGPSLVAAQAIAKGHAGAQVILVTDGVANIGVGSLDQPKDVASFNAAKNFYRACASVAQRETVIHILSLADMGENVNLAVLSVLCQQTGGRLDRLEPRRAADEIGSVLDEKAIATDVEVTILCGRPFWLSMAAPSEGAPAAVAPYLSHYVGIARTNSEVPFSFRASCKRDSPVPDVLPFQVQIRYTRPDGTKALRVITTRRHVTRELGKAQEGADIAIVSGVVNKQATLLAAEGKYEEARKLALDNQTLLRDVARTEDARNLVQMYEKEVADICKELDEQNALLDTIDCNIDRLAVQSDSLSVELCMQSEKKSAA
eukprot:CAMPEP_0119119496 /NCGR_PEP_ID=MMETSP1310-20130426/965_1 /TAXON_ID=464262 /ORGANISM="Genus nov. species nov., Strain RCC2339" /LENGTH=480 /DNA_ID=CAMNT_0007108937 /DNA_START=17 /DNA_END=1455 /DNA_ORIENTATION=-